MPPILPVSAVARRRRLPFLRVAATALAAVGVAAGSAAAPALATSTCAAQSLSVTPLQSPVFYIDISSGCLSSYVGYRVQNTGSATRTGLWQQLENFTGGVVAPAGGGAATRPVSIDSLAPDAATPSYAYLKAPAETATAQTHDVVLYDGRPGAGGTEVCRESQKIVRVLKVIDAAANKVTSASLSSASATLGGSFSLTVNGQTGTIGAGIAEDPGVIRFSPAVAADWPSSAFRLVGVTHRFPLAASPISDLLSRSNMSGSDNYTVTYTFRVVGPTATTTPLLPISNIASGTQVKHTDPGSLGSLQPIPKVSSNAKTEPATASPGPYAPGAHVALTAKIVNGDGGPLTVDEVVLRLPAGWGFVPGATTRDGAPLSEPYDAGSGELHLVGPFTVSGNGTSEFSIAATAGAPGTTGTFSTVANLAGGQIDGTTDPSDNQPAGIALRVLAAPVAQDDDVDAAAGATTTIDVLANDELDGGDATVAIEDEPATGTVAVVGGKVTYRPTDGQRAPDAFTYRVTTAAGSSVGHVALTIVDPPAAPAPGPLEIHATGTETASVAVTLPEYGTVTLLDGNGQPVDERVVDGEGTYAVDAAHDTITFTAVLGFAGTATTVAYRVTDAYNQHGDASVTAQVAKPAGPTAPARTSTGVGTTAHAVSVTVPASGAATLLDADGNPATSRTIAAEGTYTWDAATHELRFAPILGFAGTATGVAYRVTDAYNQVQDGTYVPTVTAPTPATPLAQTSIGVGTAPQTATLTVPAGTTVRLLDADGHEVTTVTVAGQGTYMLDLATGTVTFTPVLGFAGTPTPVSYRITDAYGQQREATYTPAVVAPAAPVAPAATSTGLGDAPQEQTVAVPAGGTAKLLDADGLPQTTLVVAGVGTYAIDEATGRITFAPAPGFTGAAPAVEYAVTDAYGQMTKGTYLPTVVAAEVALTAPPVATVAAAPPAVAPAPAPIATLPGPCVSNRVMTVHFKVPSGARVRAIRVAINGKVAARLRAGARSARVDLRGRPKQVVKVVVTAELARGGVLNGTRTYRTCVARRPGTLATLVLGRPSGAR